MSLIFALKGRQGDKGDKGDKGDEGDKGDQGDQGIAGASMYTDRGDPSGLDFTVGDFITNGQWHDLDLSSIVPEGATFVHIYVYMYDDSGGMIFSLRKKGKSNERNIFAIRTQVAYAYIDGDGLVACDADRVIQYRATNATWSAISVVIRGWW